MKISVLIGTKQRTCYHTPLGQEVTYQMTPEDWVMLVCSDDDLDFIVEGDDLVRLTGADRSVLHPDTFEVKASQTCRDRGTGHGRIRVRPRVDSDQVFTLILNIGR